GKRWCLFKRKAMSCGFRTVDASRKVRPRLLRRARRVARGLGARLVLLGQHVVVFTAVDALVEGPCVLAVDGDTEGNTGSSDFLRGTFRVVSEQVGTFLFGDLFEFLDRDVGDEIFLRFAAPDFEARSVLDQRRRRWDTHGDRKRAGVLVVDGYRDFHPVECVGSVVDIRDDFLDVDGCGAEFRTQWGSGVGLPAGNESFDSSIYSGEIVAARLRIAFRKADVKDFSTRAPHPRMMGLEDEIEDLRDEIAETPYNKSTEAHIGRLKSKLAEKKEKLENQSSAGGGQGYSVEQTGDATVALVGMPSAGKSTLLNALTNAESEVGAYEFTTLDVNPGMLKHKGANIQLLDVPGLIEGAAGGRGGGREVLSVI